MHEYRLANVDRTAGKRTNLRLDDWVLCRIYNKKGTIEKGLSNIDRQPTPHDHQKPVISTLDMNPPIGFTTPTPKSVLLHYDTSDSIPHCHTDTSGSGPVASPELMYDKEVQSEVKWDELERNLDLPFNYMDPFPDDPFANPAQFQNNQMSSDSSLLRHIYAPAIVRFQLPAQKLEKKSVRDVWKWYVTRVQH